MRPIDHEEGKLPPECGDGCAFYEENGYCVAGCLHQGEDDRDEP